MDRLTEKKTVGDREINVVTWDTCYDLWATPAIYAGEAIDRLAAYEDTDIDPDAVLQLKKIAEIFNCDPGNPEQLKALLERLGGSSAGVEAPIGLPCKIGDTVWAIRNYQGHKHPQQGIVSEMYYLKDMELQVVVKHIARGSWGKQVFRTCQEAEQAIEEQGRGKLG